MIVAHGDVTLVADGLTAETEQATYDKPTRIVRAPGPVTFSPRPYGGLRPRLDLR